MSFFSKIAGTLLGDGQGIASKIVGTIAGQFPEKLSDADQAQISAAITEATRDYEIQQLKAAQAANEEFNNRIISMEGTASDLQQFGVIGKILVLLRGVQRPIWGFAILYIDLKVFSGEWALSHSTGGDPLASAFWVINLLVLGFLFGERAVKNVLPLIQAKFSQKRDG